MKYLFLECATYPHKIYTVSSYCIYFRRIPIGLSEHNSVFIATTAGCGYHVFHCPPPLTLLCYVSVFVYIKITIKLYKLCCKNNEYLTNDVSSFVNIVLCF